jgi:hypothetical protein
MVMESTGGIGNELVVENTAAKGRKGGRVVYLNKPLRAALVALHEREKPSPADPIIGGTAVASRVWFHRLYEGMGFVGCSSHSGRRTAITRWARKAAYQGGSLRDVQLPAMPNSHPHSVISSSTKTPNAEWWRYDMCRTCNTRNLVGGPHLSDV